jgi:hypothetical protein
LSTGYVIYRLPLGECEAAPTSVVWEQEEADELVRRLNAGEAGRWTWREVWVHPEPERSDGYLTALDRDNLLLARAHEALGSERPVGVFFSFPFDREGALAVVSKLLGLGWTYAGVDEEVGDDGRWHAAAHGLRMRLTRESVARLRRDMERLAARHAGEYDGWDVSGGLGLRAELGELAD